MFKNNFGFQLQDISYYCFFWKFCLKTSVKWNIANIEDLIMVSIKYCYPDSIYSFPQYLI